MPDGTVKVNTKSGFSCEIDLNKFDDWRFTEILGGSDEDVLADAKMAVFVVNKVLSPKDSAALKEKCKKEDGTISNTKMTEMIKEIMSEVPQIKNS